MTTISTGSVDSNLLTAMNGSTVGKSATQEAQDRFMTLLVTQMKNQDPLNPMDNAQVTSQLAQLSTVTGIDKLNATVNAMSASFQVAQNLQTASMIGHGVVAPGNAIALADGKSIYGVELPVAADKLEITIRDSSGLAVRKLNLDGMASGINMMTWDGKTESGSTAANGLYKFEVSASSAAQKLDATALSFGVVSSISSSAQGVKISVANIGSIGMADVRQIY
jgi:flagellar basal-body rod modification protein FlgD